MRHNGIADETGSARPDNEGENMINSATDSAPALEKVLKARDVAAHLGCDEDLVYQMLRSGEIRGRRVGRLWRVPESALAEFIAGGGGSTR